MKLHNKELINIARKEAVRPHILEKSWQLLSLLDAIEKEELLEEKYALKGGTALNLFYSNAPRLSVDIDLNYIGAVDLDEVKKERAVLEEALDRIYRSMGMTVSRSTTAHAGGKYVIEYPSVLNQGKGRIEVDLNYMFRIPFFPVEKRESVEIGGRKSKPVSLVSSEEVIAGKLCALMDRDASRDLFDAYQILVEGAVKFDKQKLKIAFLAYYVMEERTEVSIPIDNVSVSEKDVAQKLRPVLRKRDGLDTDQDCVNWANEAVRSVKRQLKDILNLNDKERMFLEDYVKNGSLDFNLITQDLDLIYKLENHPKIKWAQQKKRGIRV